MRIIHDANRCASVGMCESVAPQVFEIGSDGALVVLQPTPGEDLRDLVEEAVAACPTEALRIEG